MQEFDDNSPPDHSHYVRKVVLPSGKTIEVLSFDDLEPVESDLSVCPECRSELVYPTAWQEADRASWEISLRCPNCEWMLIDTFEEDVIQRFDAALDRGTEALVDDLRRLSQANMEDDVERFVEALHAGHLLPEDF